MKRKQLKITTRAALVMYTLQAYQVDLNLDKNEIYKQRLVLVDQEALSSYLF